MTPNMVGPRPQPQVANFLKSQWSIYKTAIAYSVVIGLLSLAPTIYMLEVYDRVVNSRNFETLLMLSILVVGCYIVM